MTDGPLDAADGCSCVAAGHLAANDAKTVSGQRVRLASWFLENLPVDCANPRASQSRRGFQNLPEHSHPYKHIARRRMHQMSRCADRPMPYGVPLAYAVVAEAPVPPAPYGIPAALTRNPGGASETAARQVAEPDEREASLIPFPWQQWRSKLKDHPRYQGLRRRLQRLGLSIVALALKVIRRAEPKRPSH